MMRCHETYHDKSDSGNSADEEIITTMLNVPYDVLKNINGGCRLEWAHLVHVKIIYDVCEKEEELNKILKSKLNTGLILNFFKDHNVPPVLYENGVPLSLKDGPSKPSILLHATCRMRNVDLNSCVEMWIDEFLEPISDAYTEEDQIYNKVFDAIWKLNESLRKDGSLEKEEASKNKESSEKEESPEESLDGSLPASKKQKV